MPDQFLPQRVSVGPTTQCYVRCLRVHLDETKGVFFQVYASQKLSIFVGPSECDSRHSK